MKSGHYRIWNVMTLVGKAGKLDEVKAIIDNNGTIEDIRRIL